MSTGNWADLLMQSLLEPREAAVRIIALRASPQTAVAALVLAAVLNALIYGLVLSETPAAALIPEPMRPPLIYALAAVAMLGLIAAACHQIGRGMGGTARLADLVMLMAWGQILRFLAQVLILLIQVVSPMFGLTLTLLAMGWLLWISLNFLDVAQGFGSLAKAAMLLTFAMLALFIWIVLVTALIGPMALEAPNV